MAHSNSTAPVPAQLSESTTKSAGFDKLLSRLLGLVHHFQCADQRLWNFNETPPEYQAAATVLHDATEALDRFYDDLDAHHAHIARQEAEAARDTQPTADAPELPEPFQDYLQEQHTRVSELLSLLERLDEDDETPMCTRIAVREAQALERALDSLTIAKMLRGEQGTQS